MAADSPDFISGLQAGGDLSAKQYNIMKAHTTANQITTATAATDFPVGILYNKPTAAGQGANLASFKPGSVVKVKVGSAGLTAGSVGTNASGLAVTKTANNDIIFGRVDKSYSASDIAEVLCQGVSYLGA